MDTPIDNFMQISARDLKEASPTTTALKLEIKKHVQYIQADIRDKHRAKIRFTQYDLPVNFDIPNLSNSEAQTHIYAGVIEQLKHNKFEVGMQMSRRPLVCRLEISWISDQDLSEADRQKRIIQEALGTKIIKDSPVYHSLS